MTTTQKIRLRLSKVRQRLNEIAGIDDLTDEIRTEAESLQGEYRDLETRHQASIIAEGEPVTSPAAPDAELRERLELRSRCTLTNFVTAALQGRMVDGPEAELAAAAEVRGSAVPLELFDVETRVDAATPSPTTGTGVNLDPILPAIFARAVLPRLGVAMPRVKSGQYATGTITTSQSAAAIEKGMPASSTAGAITTKTTGPHRVTARLSVQLEDVASVGTANFEEMLRQNAQLALSDRLDHLGLTGDGTDPNPQGLLSQLTDPADPSAVLDFDAFVSLAAGGIDGGPWAESMGMVRLLVNPETMRMAETTFQSTATYKGEMSAAAYLRSHAGMFVSSSRMPTTVTTIAQALRYRAGTMGLDGVNAIRTAVCPVYNSVSIDDIYSDSASGRRHFTMHVLIGDVLITQPSAYERVDVKLS